MGLTWVSHVYHLCITWVRFVTVEEAMGDDNPDIKLEMYRSCQEARHAGKCWYYMSVTWVVHGYHVAITWVSRVYHMAVTLLSHGYHQGQNFKKIQESPF